MKRIGLLLAALCFAFPSVVSAQHNVRQPSATVATTTSVPFKLYGGHICLQARVDGKPYAFVFDTAGAASLSALAERQLALPVVATTQMTGAGNGTDSMSVVVPKEASVGDATIKNAYFMVLPERLDLGSPFPGVPFGGILGREFFARLIVTIDYAKQTLTLTNPQSFHADAAAIAIPLTMRNGAFPNVQATVDGAAGSFDIDAGSPQSLILTEPFAKRNGIVAQMPRTFEVNVGHGVGGGMTGTAGRVAALRVGTAVLDDVVAYVIHATGGVFSDEGLSGNIGGEVLRRFTVTIDVPHKTLYLAKNVAFGTPFTFTRAGLFIEHTGGSLSVVAVIPGSPAQVAGLRAGDSLVSIADRPVDSLSSDEVRGYWLMPAGTVVHVEARRDGKTRGFNLTLRDLL
jgi:predicted aspartyl protease